MQPKATESGVDPVLIGLAGRIVVFQICITIDIVETINRRLGDSFQCWPIKASEEAGKIWRDAGRRTR